MFNLEGLIPKMCQLAREIGDDGRALRLRSVGMQTLAVLVKTHNSLSLSAIFLFHYTCTNLKYLNLEPLQVFWGVF